MSASVRTLAVLLALVACGTPAPRAPGDAEAVFPHPDGYTEQGHATQALDRPEACVQCHDPDQGAGSGPSCGSCHAAYPHEGVRPGAVHGPAWLGDPTACTDCHGAQGDRAPAGLPAARCVSCHHTFPHGPDAVGAHGAQVVARGGTEACAGCHAIHAAPDGDPGACQRCHGGTAQAGPYPHPPGFGAPATHGPLARPTCTGACHQPADAGFGPACASCHDLYPHPAGFDALGHVPVVQARGERACHACHAPGTPRAPAMPLSCGASCHGGAP